MLLAFSQRDRFGHWVSLTAFRVCVRKHDLRAWTDEEVARSIECATTTATTAPAASIVDPLTAGFLVQTRRIRKKRKKKKTREEANEAATMRETRARAAIERTGHREIELFLNYLTMRSIRAYSSSVISVISMSFWKAFVVFASAIEPSYLVEHVLQWLKRNNSSRLKCTMFGINKPPLELCALR